VAATELARQFAAEPLAAIVYTDIATDGMMSGPNLSAMAAMQAARVRQLQLTKPPGSLGRLESLSIQIAGIQGTARPEVSRKALFVMAGDHGMVAEGVTAFPRDVTWQMVANFAAGGAAINVLAEQLGAKVIVVDVGVVADVPPHPAVIVKKVGRGTKNMAIGPAKTREEAVRALEVGIEVLEAELPLQLAGVGDMGIGNTTPSAAIIAAITGRDRSIASSATMPKPSPIDGTTTTSARSIATWIGLTWPRTWTDSAMPSSRAIARSAGSSGPRPAMSSSLVETATPFVRPPWASGRSPRHPRTRESRIALTCAREALLPAWSRFRCVLACRPATGRSRSLPAIVRELRAPRHVQTSS
jgi:hypothetical protein